MREIVRAIAEREELSSRRRLRKPQEIATGSDLRDFPTLGNEAFAIIQQRGPWHEADSAVGAEQDAACFARQCFRQRPPNLIV